MPGFVLHLAAARFYLQGLPDSDPLKYSEQMQNDFYVGNILPDTGKNKLISHFWDPRYRDRIIEWPKPQWFCRKYREQMSEPLCRGYWLHLLVDKYFLQEYIPRVVRFLDEEGRETDLRKEIVWAQLRRTGEKIPLERYLSEEYYYGDYTRMTSWLTGTFDLPRALEPAGYRGIEEADYGGISEIMKKLADYRQVPGGTSLELKVFDAEELVEFLRNVVQKAESLRGE